MHKGKKWTEMREKKRMKEENWLNKKRGEKIWSEIKGEERKKRMI